MDVGWVCSQFDDREKGVNRMAGSVNKVVLVGNLGAEPEVRHTQDGRPVVNLRLATSESWRDKATGERRERTEWHRVVIFNEGLCRIAEQYLHKGSKLYLEGQLQTRKWEDQSGQERYTTEIVLQGYNCALTMLDSRGGSTESVVNQSRGEESARPSPSDPNQGQSPNFSEEFDDEVPF